MTQNFQCGDQAALVVYLYDDCEPLEREAIAAHVISCPTCAEELAMLAATRRQLASWTPPEARLGFRITAAAADSTVVALRPAGDDGSRGANWWRQPLPAWAQLAAAAAIFATGLAVGSGRPKAAPTTAEQPTAAALRADLGDLARRLSTVEQLARTPNEVGPAAVVRSDWANDAVILKRIEQEIAASEERQRSLLAVRLVGLVDTQNRIVSEQIESKVTQVRSENAAAIGNVFQLVSLQR